MWLLRDSNEKKRYLKPGEITIGRKQSNIILENDTSISRTHSTIKVTLKKEATTNERASTCIVKDEKSKYGTHVTRNGVKMKVSNDGFELQPFDILQFGLQQHVFTVEYIPIVSVISRLNTEHQLQLKVIMNEIGGLVTDIFDDHCTHLTSTIATCTTKTISAIIAGVPIVNMNYWSALLKAVEKNEELPNAADFTLPLQDKGVNSQRVSLKPNPVRKTLFQGKKFIFFSEKVCKEYNKMIKDAGGKVELYNGSFKNIPENFFNSNNLIMQVTADESLTNDLAAFNTLVYDKMQEKNLRMISETEIPLAILYVSLDQYCNPKFHFKELIKRKNLKEDKSKILALDTQDILMTSNNEHAIKVKQVCLPETNDFMEENTPQDDSNCLSVVKPQFDSEKNSLTEIAIQKRNVGASDKILVNEVMDVDNNSSDTSEPVRTIESSGCDDSTTNKPSSSFRLKRSSTSDFELKESKKRVKDKISNDEMTKNVQSGWKTKKCVNSLEIIKKQSTLTKIEDDFDVLEQKKSEIREKKQDKLSKWGFKKIAKKSIDFDLDDFEENEPKVEARTKTVKSSCNSNKECEESLKETLESQKPSKTFESDKDNSNLQIKSLNDNKHLKENMDKNWTAFKASKMTSSKSNLSVDNRPRGSLLVRSTIKVEETDNEVTKNIKTFKKVHSIIPIKRIALADMTVWRPNS